MIKTTKQTPASGAKVAMTEDTLEEIAMTRDLKKTDDMKKEEEGMTGKAAEKKDETEAGKKKTGEVTKKEETETKDEVVPGGLEEKDLDPKDQEGANPEDQEEVPIVRENHQEDQEVDQGTRSTPARGS